MTTTFRSLSDLTEQLRADGVPHEANEGQVWLPVEEGELRTTAMILWPADVALLQVVIPLPFQSSEPHLPGLHEALARLNHALIVPGFGLDHEHAQPYFRIVQPRAVDGSVELQDVQRALGTAVRTAAQFGGLLQGVAIGELAPGAVTDGLA